MFDYEQALRYLNGLRKFGIKLGNERFAEMCVRMGNPQDGLSVIHVGGTNGKGSTCAFVASILRAAGYRVGTYLSPYVYDVRERILVDGEMIPKADFAALMSEIAPVMEDVAKTEHGDGTEFEAKTLMAFLHFARTDVDVSVIEVGMGGRYDCTNLVTPLVAVITNVSLDHTERLGDTVEQIAWDKAGIAKAGAPLVTAATGAAWRTIHDTAREQGVEEIWRVLAKAECGRRKAEAGSRLEVTGYRLEGEGEDAPGADRIVRFDGHDGQVTVDLPDGRIGPVALRLAGDFQYANAATAAAAISALSLSVQSGQHPTPNTQQLPRVPHSASVSGLASAYLPGRLEVLRRNPTVVIDAAHNPDGAARLAESVRKLFAWRRLTLVIGMLSTHEADGVLSALAPLADRVIATRSGWEKSRPASEVADAASAANPKAEVVAVEPVTAAVHEALYSAQENDLVLITGSFYTIGEVDREAVAEGRAGGGG